MSNVEFNIDSRLTTTSNSGLSAGANAFGNLLAGYGCPTGSPSNGQVLTWNSTTSEFQWAAN